MVAEMKLWDRTLTRRELVHRTALASLLPLVASSSTRASHAASGLSLQELINQGDCRIPRQQRPYVLEAPLTIPRDRSVTIEAGTRFEYVGPPGDAAELGGVFIVTGDDVSLVVEDGGTAYVTARGPSPYLYAVRSRGPSRVLIRGIMGVNCLHVLATGTAENYAQARVESRDSVARDIRVEGGGSRFTVPQKEGHGACMVMFAFDWQLSGATYENVTHGVEWWGGDSDFARDGARRNERRCGDFRIASVTVRKVAGGGIWGSMGTRGLVENCTVEDCGDVGFDAEGSSEIIFRACTSEDARNGCFATFHACNEISFVNCTGRVSNAAFPLFRMYNYSHNNVENGRIEIVGGRFECTDKSAAGTIDTASGGSNYIGIRQAELVNVRIDTAHSNMHRTEIVGNRLTFPYAVRRFAAIRAGSSKSTDRVGGATVEGNRITSLVPQVGLDAGHKYGEAQDVGSAGIEIYEDDYNSSATSRVSDNIVSDGFHTPIVVWNASQNAAREAIVEIAGNRIGRARSGRTSHAGIGTLGTRPPRVIWGENVGSDGTRLAAP